MLKISDFEINWPRSIALVILTALLFWGYGCPSQVSSLTTPGRKITRPELQLELDAIVATAEFRMAQLAQQDRVRDIIFKNGMLVIETGTMNPAGIITLLLGLYGATRGTTDFVKKVKKKSNNT